MLLNINVHRPFVYAFVLGHIGRFEGRNVIDAIRVREVSHPHEWFHHALDVFVQHVFANQQQASVSGVTHEREDSESDNLRSVQRQRIL
jgi:hypothetical protein